jgi:hypothetical protein
MVPYLRYVPVQQENSVTEVAPIFSLDVQRQSELYAG